MNILINASNIKIGGGIQVADYFCKSVVEKQGNAFKQKFSGHRFFIVLSSYLNSTKSEIDSCPDIKTYTYDIKNSPKTLLFGRDAFLDSLVREKKIDFVFSVFGPSRWIPKVRHLCGFAMGQLVLQDSPFYSVCSLKQKIYWKFLFFYSRKFLFHRCSKLFYSENEYISDRVEQIFKNTKCYTVTNYYNPIYDTPEKQTTKPLPYFNGITLLTISTAYPYKNLQISLRVAHILKTKYPNLSFRFVFTCQKEEFLDCEYVKRGLIFKNNKKEEKIYDLDLENFVFIGKVDLKDCPSLYEQCDMVFLPSLMECFTALYPESFRMQKPLLTSDLPFARGLCGKAAEYFPALDAEKIAQTIHQLANNTSRQKELIKQGLRQLSLYDNNTQRMETVMSIMEKHFH